MIDKSNKKFWDKFAKLYAPFMKKDKGVYDKVCEYIRPHLNKDMEVLELACGSGQLSFNLSKLYRFKCKKYFYILCKSTFPFILHYPYTAVYP